MKRTMIKGMIAFILCISVTSTLPVSAATSITEQNAANAKLSVTNQPITVQIVRKKSHTVVRSFTLKANKVVTFKKQIEPLGTQIVIRHKTEPTGTIFVTKAEKFTYTNKVTALTAKQKKHLDQLEKTWHEQLTTNQKKSLKDYTASGFIAINGALRGLSAATPATDNRIKAIDHAIAKFKHPYKVTLWRGTKVKTFKYGLEKGKLYIGARYSDKGYLSTSLIKDGIIGFGTNAIVKIQIQKGAPTAPLYKISNYENEQEMLLKHDTKFVVTGIKKTDDCTWITVNLLKE